MDVETAFPEGTLEEHERMHMKCPPGMNLGKDECLEICKGVHGLVQSARLHWLNMSQVLESPDVGFKKSDADQCPFMKIGKKKTVTPYLVLMTHAFLGPEVMWMM